MQTRKDGLGAGFSQVVRDTDGNPEVALYGNVSAKNAFCIVDAIRAAEWIPGEMITLRLAEIDFLDSTGIQLLLREGMRLNETGKNLCLHGIRPALLRVLQQIGFDQIFMISQEEKETLFPLPQDVSSYGDYGRGGAFLSFTVPASLDLLHFIRERALQFLQRFVADADLLDSIRLAFGEAVSNAIRHGCKEDLGKHINVAILTNVRVDILVEDPGGGFDLSSVPVPDVVTNTGGGGFGIYIIREIMDSVEYFFSDSGTCLRMSKRLVPETEGTQKP